MPHHLANGELRFPVGRELGPILGDRSLVVDQSPIDESVDDGSRHTFGRREDHGRTVCRPRHLAGPVRPAGPYVDDGLTVEIDRQRSAAEPATWKHVRESTNDAGEVWVRRTEHAMPCVRGIAGGDRTEIDPGFCRHRI